MNILISNITKQYGDKKLFDNISMNIEKNKITSIIGPSGCGKTTLLNIIAGEENYQNGTINGIEDSDTSYVFQEPRLLEWHNVYKNIEFVLRSKYKKKECNQVISRYLKHVKLLDYKDYYPSQLSGGMKQRVSLARAFSYPSSILLMDEPFSGIDYNLKKELINDFVSLFVDNQRTVVYVSHDIEEVMLLSHKIIILSDDDITKVKDIVEINSDLPGREINKLNIYKEKILKIMTS
ncbi:MAG: ABC transporter ATP-binding protein [Eubacteriaceae bacterium]